MKDQQSEELVRQGVQLGPLVVVLSVTNGVHACLNRDETWSVRVGSRVYDLCSVSAAFVAYIYGGIPHHPVPAPFSTSNARRRVDRW